MDGEVVEEVSKFGCSGSQTRNYSEADEDVSSLKVRSQKRI